MTDLAVIGAGTTGAWTAFRGVRAGRATALVDAVRAGHPRVLAATGIRTGADSMAADWDGY